MTLNEFEFDLIKALGVKYTCVQMSYCFLLFS